MDRELVTSTPAQSASAIIFPLTPDGLGCDKGLTGSVYEAACIELTGLLLLLRFLPRPLVVPHKGVQLAALWR